MIVIPSPPSTLRQGDVTAIELTSTARTVEVSMQAASDTSPSYLCTLKGAPCSSGIGGSEAAFTASVDLGEVGDVLEEGEVGWKKP